MLPGLLTLLQRRKRPPLALGISVALVCVVAETFLAELLQQVTPVRSLGILYLLGVVMVTSVWGLWLGMATALVSTIALDYFLIPPVASLTLDKAESWTVLAVFVAVTLLAGSVSKLARSLAVEVDARAEADLSAELARILLHAPDLRTGQRAAAEHLARALRLPSVVIRPGVGRARREHVVFPLRDHGTEVASMLVPTGLPRPMLRRLRDRVVPSLEVLLQAARARQRITDEQAALRRLATLVARGAPPGEIFGAVAREVGQVLGEGSNTVVFRHEPDAMATTVGIWNPTVPASQRWPLEKGTPGELLVRTKAPVRLDSLDGTGEVLTALRDMGIKSTVGCPITVGGRLWGSVIVGSTSGPVPEDTEKRLLDFTDLVATAIANADSHDKLRASRARVLAAADATRRLIERDLHDGTQHRLVSLMLELRAAQVTPPAERDEVSRLLSHTIRVLDEALEDLRDIARGLHPALLSRRGLQPAVKALARCSPVPVELTMCVDGRLPQRFEATAYHVVAEALTNAAAHAEAAVVRVGVTVQDGTIRLSVRDDGRVGADPGRGSGLLGITDRVEALGGRLEIRSPVGGGTSLFTEIPIADD